MPTPGFFARPRGLGRYDGEETGQQAFHAAELAAAATFWGDPARKGTDG